MHTYSVGLKRVWEKFFDLQQIKKLTVLLFGHIQGKEVVHFAGDLVPVSCSFLIIVVRYKLLESIIHFLHEVRMAAASTKGQTLVNFAFLGVRRREAWLWRRSVVLLRLLVMTTFFASCSVPANSWTLSLNYSRWCKKEITQLQYRNHLLHWSTFEYLVDSASTLQRLLVSLIF